MLYFVFIDGPVYISGFALTADAFFEERGIPSPSCGKLYYVDRNLIAWQIVDDQSEILSARSSIRRAIIECIAHEYFELNKND